MASHYRVKEVFYSPQGEGHRVGTMNVFLRFVGCNLQCVDADLLDRPLRGNEVSAGFNCDTDFQGGERLTLEEVVRLVLVTDTGKCGNVILTGGEPALQVDKELLDALRAQGYFLAIETNGTRPLPTGLNWVSCSPKPTTKPVITHADEVRVVVRAGQAPDVRGVYATHLFVSPAFRAPGAEHVQGFHGSHEDLDPEAAAWAVEWCRGNPAWRVSLQTHKFLGVR